MYNATKKELNLKNRIFYSIHKRTEDYYRYGGHLLIFDK